MSVAIGSQAESKKDEQKISKEPKNSDHGIHRKHLQVSNLNQEVPKRDDVLVS
jgi:hypothetical protein